MSDYRVIETENGLDQISYTVEQYYLGMWVAASSPFIFEDKFLAIERAKKLTTKSQTVVWESGK